MPLHTSTRRQFITRSFFGSLAVLTLHHTQAAGEGGDHWALFSDTHIGADVAERKRGINMAEHLQAAVAEVVALPRKPAGLIINGDLAMDAGLPGDYATFTELLKPLVAAEVPLHFTLGNHDHREVFWNALSTQAALPRPVAGRQVSIVETPTANWFLLDSLEITNQTSGLLGEEQRRWLGQALASRSEKPALVMVHHNPVSSDPKRKTGLKDGSELLALLAPLRHVKAVLFGHTHSWELSVHEGLHLVNLPAVAYAFAPEQVTGWVDCHLQPGGMRLEVRATDPANAEHGRVINFRWRT